MWGHGSDEDFGVKIGPGPRANPGGPAAAGIDPEEMDRYIHLGSDIDDLAASVRRAFPGLDPRPSKVIPCLITDTPDGQFIVGRPVSESRVVVAGGDSGHGFKHAAGVGELLARIVAGDAPTARRASWTRPASNSINYRMFSQEAGNRRLLVAPHPPGPHASLARWTWKDGEVRQGRGVPDSAARELCALERVTISSSRQPRRSSHDFPRGDHQSTGGSGFV